MNIKSLLLGSAAALVAVSGARAADAVVIPEPEAVEYVRVCDAAGAGYFYIPGGETCLKISGYVRYEISGNQDSDGWAKNTEGRVLFQSWTDSEYGPVTANIRFDANVINGNTDGTVGLAFGGPAPVGVAVSAPNYVTMDRAYLTIGGLNMGLDTNLYDFDQDGAADALTANGVDRNQISYTADFGAGTFAIQLVEDTTNAVLFGPADYVPNVIAKATFDLGGIGIAAAVGYDDNNSLGGSSWGAKVTATYAGFGAQVAYSDNAGGAAAQDYSAAYDWVLAANYGFDATSKLNINVAAVYGINEGALGGGDNDFVVGVEAKYAMTETFEVSARVRYMEDTVALNAADTDGWNWRMRFTSSF